jgi:hypothetical protein
MPGTGQRQLRDPPETMVNVRHCLFADSPFLDRLDAEPGKLIGCEVLGTASIAGCRACVFRSNLACSDDTTGRRTVGRRATISVTSWRWVWMRSACALRAGPRW